MPSATTRYYAFSFFAFAFSWVPVMYPYFVGLRGLTNQQFLDLQAVYYTTMVLLEVPAGMFADKVGRRWSLLLGCLALSASFVLLGSNRTWSWFLFGEALMGGGHALISGADSAFLYDSLAQQGRAAEYLKCEARATLSRLCGVALADILGGIATAALGLTAGFLTSAVLLLIAAGIALTFVEPAVHASPGSALRQRGSFVRSVQLCLTHRHVRWAFAYFAVIFLLLRIGFHFYQPHLQEIGIKSYVFNGVLFAGLTLCAAPFAVLTPRLERRYGERTLLASQIGIMGASFLLLGAFAASWSWLLFVMQQVPFGIHLPALRSYTNRHVPSVDRATVLSWQSLFGRLLFAGFAHGIGRAWDRLGRLEPIFSVLGYSSIGLAIMLYATMPPTANVEDRP